MDWLIRALSKKVLLLILMHVWQSVWLWVQKLSQIQIHKYIWHVWHVWHNVGLWAQKRWLSIIKPFCKSGLERGCRIVLTIKRKGRRRRHIQPNHWSWSLVCRVARKIRFPWDLLFSFLSPIFCIFLSDLTIDHCQQEILDLYSYSTNISHSHAWFYQLCGW